MATGDDMRIDGMYLLSTPRWEKGRKLHGSRKYIETCRVECSSKISVLAAMTEFFESRRGEEKSRNA